MAFVGREFIKCLFREWESNRYSRSKAGGRDKRSGRSQRCSNFGAHRFGFVRRIHGWLISNLNLFYVSIIIIFFFIACRFLKILWLGHNLTFMKNQSIFSVLTIWENFHMSFLKCKRIEPNFLVF